MQQEMQQIFARFGAEDWAELGDEELLDLKMADLPLAVEGTLAERIAQLRSELDERGLRFPLHFYISDEWFTPDGATAIAVPFYLAHPRLERLEEAQMFEVEGGEYEWGIPGQARVGAADAGLGAGAVHAAGQGAHAPVCLRQHAVGRSLGPRAAEFHGRIRRRRLSGHGRHGAAASRRRLRQRERRGEPRAAGVDAGNDRSVRDIRRRRRRRPGARVSVPPGT